MRYLLLAAALGSVAAPALAQENAPFTGPHVEALLGYDVVGTPDDNRDGLLYGASAGYDFQIGGLVAGFEGEITDSTTRARENGIAVAGDSASIRAARDLYVGGRIGFVVAPKTMIYAKGGYTNARFKSEYNDGAGVTTLSANDLDGYRIGAGIEQKLNLFGPSGFVKAEYRYSNYRNLNAGQTNVDIDLDRHQLLMGIGVRF
ncbi:MAG: outer membrane beta-barrel protein [Sphingomonadales bacterium]